MRPGDHRVTIAFFALSVAMLLVMRMFFPATLAIPLKGSEISPVLLLEFAGRPEHLVHIFGFADDPQFAERVRGMTIGNALDYLFMPIYGMLVFSFFAGVARELGKPAWRIFGYMGLVAALADAVENFIMFRMVGHMADPLGEMAVLPYPVWTKFGLLALACGGAAIALLRMRRYVLAALCIPAPLLIIPGWLDPYGLGPLATSMIALGWIAMALHAGSRWWQARRQG